MCSSRESAAVGDVGGVVLWDVATRERLADPPLPVSEGAVLDVAFSPDGKTLAAGFGSRVVGGVVLWDVATRKRLIEATLPVNEGTVWGLAFSPDGKALAAGYAGPGGGGAGAVAVGFHGDRHRRVRRTRPQKAFGRGRRRALGRGHAQAPGR